MTKIKKAKIKQETIEQEMPEIMPCAHHKKCTECMDFYGAAIDMYMFINAYEYVLKKHGATPSSDGFTHYTQKGVDEIVGNLRIAQANFNKDDDLVKH